MDSSLYILIYSWSPNKTCPTYTLNNKGASTELRLFSLHMHGTLCWYLHLYYSDYVFNHALEKCYCRDILVIACTPCHEFAPIYKICCSAQIKPVKGNWIVGFIPQTWTPSQCAWMRSVISWRMRMPSTTCRPWWPDSWMWITCSQPAYRFSSDNNNVLGYLKP